MNVDRDQAALEWQTGIWDRMSDVYLREIDKLFEPAIIGVLARAELKPGERVLDLGTGTGAVAARAAELVGPDGDVVGVDISREMLARARRRFLEARLANVTLQEGRAESIPAEDAAFDTVIASLSLMFAIDRAASAREIARVLRLGGRFVASVWAGPDDCDLIRFQQIAGSFAPTPPIPGVGPGALGDTFPFIAQLKESGVHARTESEVFGFDFDSFNDAWEVFADVTAAQLSPERKQEAKDAVLAAMYPNGDGPRHFRNVARFIVGERVTSNR
jgi:SAM-dependent methyltransferase